MNTPALAHASPRGEWFEMDTSLGDEAGSKWSDYMIRVILQIPRGLPYDDVRGEHAIAVQLP